MFLYVVTTLKIILLNTRTSHRNPKGLNADWNEYSDEMDGVHLA